MSEPKRQEDRHLLQHEAEHAKPRKNVSVMGYLAILFAAAFLLLLLSYFMQQRNSEQTISGLQDSVTGLKDSVSAMQSVENLISDNQALHDQVAELEEEIQRLNSEMDSLTDQNKQYGTSLAQQEKRLTAMDWLWRIQRAWSRGQKAECRELADQFEATGLPSSLPDTALSGVDGPSPAEQYDALLDALDYRPEP